MRLYGVDSGINSGVGSCINLHLLRVDSGGHNCIVCTFVGQSRGTMPVPLNWHFGDLFFLVPLPNKYR